MAEAKVFVGGVWTPLCDIKYNKRVGSNWEPFYTRPVTFYNNAGTPFTFECTKQVDPVSVFLGDETETSILVEWVLSMDPQNPTPQGDRFDVYNANTNTIIASDVTGQSYEHTGLNDDTEYCYYVIAKATGFDDSVASNEACTSTLAYPQPNNVTIGDCSGRENNDPDDANVLVSFTSKAVGDPDVDEYRLLYRLTGDTPDQYNLVNVAPIPHDTNSTTETFTITANNLIAGEEYHFVVRADGPGGSSDVNDTLACITFYSGDI